MDGHDETAASNSAAPESDSLDGIDSEDCDMFVVLESVECSPAPQDSGADDAPFVDERAPTSTAAKDLGSTLDGAIIILDDSDTEPSMEKTDSDITVTKIEPAVAEKENLEEANAVVKVQENALVGIDAKKEAVSKLDTSASDACDVKANEPLIIKHMLNLEGSLNKSEISPTSCHIEKEPVKVVVGGNSLVETETNVDAVILITTDLTPKPASNSAVSAAVAQSVAVNKLDQGNVLLKNAKNGNTVSDRSRLSKVSNVQSVKETATKDNLSGSVKQCIVRLVKCDSPATSQKPTSSSTTVIVTKSVNSVADSQAVISKQVQSVEHIENKSSEAECVIPSESTTSTLSSKLEPHNVEVTSDDKPIIPEKLETQPPAAEAVDAKFTQNSEEIERDPDQPAPATQADPVLPIEDEAELAESATEETPRLTWRLPSDISSTNLDTSLATEAAKLSSVVTSPASAPKETDLALAFCDELRKASESRSLNRMDEQPKVSLYGAEAAKAISMQESNNTEKQQHQDYRGISQTLLLLREPASPVPRQPPLPRTAGSPAGTRMNLPPPPPIRGRRGGSRMRMRMEAVSPPLSSSGPRMTIAERLLKLAEGGSLSSAQDDVPEPTAVAATLSPMKAKSPPKNDTATDDGSPSSSEKSATAMKRKHETNWDVSEDTVEDAVPISVLGMSVLVQKVQEAEDGPKLEWRKTQKLEETSLDEPKVEWRPSPGRRRKMETDFESSRSESPAPMDISRSPSPEQDQDFRVQSSNPHVNNQRPFSAPPPQMETGLFPGSSPSGVAQCPPNWSQSCTAINVPPNLGPASVLTSGPNWIMPHPQGLMQSPSPCMPGGPPPGSVMVTICEPAPFFGSSVNQMPPNVGMPLVQQPPQLIMGPPPASQPGLVYQQRPVEMNPPHQIILEPFPMSSASNVNFQPVGFGPPPSVVVVSHGPPPPHMGSQPMNAPANMHTPPPHSLGHTVIMGPPPMHSSPCGPPGNMGPPPNAHHGLPQNMGPAAMNSSCGMLQNMAPQPMNSSLCGPAPNMGMTPMNVLTTPPGSLGQPFLSMSPGPMNAVNLSPQGQQLNICPSPNMGPPPTSLGLQSNMGPPEYRYPQSSMGLPPGSMNQASSMGPPPTMSSPVPMHTMGPPHSSVSSFTMESPPPMNCPSQGPPPMTMSQLPNDGHLPESLSAPASSTVKPLMSIKPSLMSIKASPSSTEIVCRPPGNLSDVSAPSMVPPPGTVEPPKPNPFFTGQHEPPGLGPPPSDISRKIGFGPPDEWIDEKPDMRQPYWSPHHPLARERMQQHPPEWNLAQPDWRPPPFRGPPGPPGFEGGPPPQHWGGPAPFQPPPHHPCGPPNQFPAPGFPPRPEFRHPLPPGIMMPAGGPPPGPVQPPMGPGVPPHAVPPPEWGPAAQWRPPPGPVAPPRFHGAPHAEWGWAPPAGVPPPGCAYPAPMQMMPGWGLPAVPDPSLSGGINEGLAQAAREWAEWSQRYSEWYYACYGTPAPNPTPYQTAIVQPTNASIVTTAAVVSSIATKPKISSAYSEPALTDIPVPKTTVVSAVSITSAVIATKKSSKAGKDTASKSSGTKPKTSSGPLVVSAKAIISSGPVLFRPGDRSASGANSSSSAQQTSKSAGVGEQKSAAGANLLINNLPVGTKAVDVRTLISQYGKVVNCKVGVMKSQKEAGGLFALVAMEREHDATLCINRLNLSTFGGQTISVMLMKTS